MVWERKNVRSERGDNVMTPRRSYNVLWGFILCCCLSICNGVGIPLAIAIFCGILLYNRRQSKKEFTKAEHQKHQKTVWSSKQKRFISIPKKQDTWE